MKHRLALPAMLFFALIGRCHADEDFSAGIFTDQSSTYLISGPAPSQTGRTLWTISTLDAKNKLSAVWETGPAIGNSYVGNTSGIQNNPSTFGAGKSYGVVGDADGSKGLGYAFSKGITISVSAAQAGTLLTFTSLNSDGTQAYGGAATLTKITTNSAVNSGSTFVAGVYRDGNGQDYLISGPSSSQNGRSVWSITAVNNSANQFSAVWETGAAIGNTYISNYSSIITNPNGFGTGRSYGLVGLASGTSGPAYYFSRNALLSAAQVGNTLTLTELNANGTQQYSGSYTLLLSGKSSAVGGATSTTAFAAGNYQDGYGQQYLISGPSPTQGGRNLWSITTVNPNGNEFNAIWETGSPIGSTYLGANPALTNAPAGFPSGRAYGVVGVASGNSGPAYTFSRGGFISAAQVGNTLVLQSLNTDGTQSGGSFVLTATDPATPPVASTSSEAFLPGVYSDIKGNTYTITNSNSGWSLSSTVNGSSIQFNASWQTGSAAANPLVSGTSAYKNYASAFVAGRSYGVVGAAQGSSGPAYNFSKGSLLAAAQVGSTLTLSQLNSDGSLSSSAHTFTLSGDATAGTGSGNVTFGAPSLVALKTWTQLSIPVNRVGGAKGIIGVGWQALEGTAKLGVDYNSGNGNLAWQDGDATTKFITIKLTPNRLPAGRTFSVQLQTPANTSIGNTSTLSIAINNPTINVVRDEERLFNWAEQTYPQIFSSAQTTTFDIGLGYSYRCYNGLSACLASGFGTDADSLYFYSPATGIARVGTISQYLQSISGY